MSSTKSTRTQSKTTRTPCITVNGAKALGTSVPSSNFGQMKERHRWSIEQASMYAEFDKKAANNSYIQNALPHNKSTMMTIVLISLDCFFILSS